MNFAGSTKGFAIGVDIGGTCTDVAMIDAETNEQFFFKTETCPGHVEDGVINGISAILKQQGRRPEDCSTFIHGTTLALNAVLTRQGARIGLLVTSGFRDVLEIGRLQMPDPFDFYTQKERPLIRRNFVREVNERILGNGQVDTPLDSASVEAAADELLANGAERLVVCFINGFKNPAHEVLAAEIIKKRHPTVSVSLSSQVWPEIREYERTMATVVNAFVTPKVATYLDRLQERLDDLGLSGSVNITTSNGGMLPVGLAKERPGTMLMSGPASGVIASAHIAEICGIKNAMVFDMGGTSSDFAVLTDYQIPYTSETRIGDLPVIFPSVDVVSVGAGGGSIARLDNLGVLKVGPDSAGADPGPVCYGRGGELPTITDAYLVTGILDAKNFLGGRVKLAADLAYKAIESLAVQTGYSVEELAEGILRVATSNLILGIGQIEGRVGLDIRDFAILAYGGAGPTHACMLADELDIRHVIVPTSPGTLCALGSLSADFRMDFVQTINTSFLDADWDAIRAWFAEKEAEATRHFKQEGADIEVTIAMRSGDVRYEGQGFNTDVPMSQDILEKGDAQAFAGAFNARYEQLYGVAQTSTPVELVNVRLTMIGKRTRNSGMQLAAASGALTPFATRNVFFDGKHHTLPVYQRSDMGVGDQLQGPCIVDQPDTTTFIRPDWHANVDANGILHLERR